MFRVNLHRYARLLAICLGLMPFGQVFAYGFCNHVFVNDSGNTDPMNDLHMAHQTYLLRFEEWTDQAFNLATLQRGQFALDQLLFESGPGQIDLPKSNSEFHRVLDVLTKTDHLLDVVVPAARSSFITADQVLAAKRYFHHVPSVRALNLLDGTNKTGVVTGKYYTKALNTLLVSDSLINRFRHAKSGMVIKDLIGHIHEEIGVITDFRSVLTDTVDLIADKDLQIKIIVALLEQQQDNNLYYDSTQDAAYKGWNYSTPAEQLEKLYLDLDRVVLSQIAQRKRLVSKFKTESN